MAIEEDMATFERQLNELVVKYEQYFLGVEKLEPLQLREQVERWCRRYLPIQIVNTMMRFRYTSLVARYQTYQQHWNKILRLMEEGKYSRDRFKADLRSGRLAPAPAKQREEQPSETEKLYRQYMEARRKCGLGSEGVDRGTIEQALERQRPLLKEKYKCADVEFRVVVEEGKPKIKARPRT